MSTKKFWTLRDWPIAIEAKDELEAVTRLTKSLSDIADKIKGGENIKNLFIENVEANQYYAAYDQLDTEYEDEMEAIADPPQDDKKKKWNIN